MTAQTTIFFMGIVAFAAALFMAVLTFPTLEPDMTKIILPAHLNEHALEIEYTDGTFSNIQTKGRPGIIAEGRMLGFQEASDPDGDKTYILLHTVAKFKVTGPASE